MSPSQRTRLAIVMICACALGGCSNSKEDAQLELIECGAFQSEIPQRLWDPVYKELQNIGVQPIEILAIPALANSYTDKFDRTRFSARWNKGQTAAKEPVEKHDVVGIAKRLKGCAGTFNAARDDSGGGDVRFLLAFAVSVDGAVKTGSSVINVLFYGGGDTKSGSPYRYYTSTEGVAPVIDLGSHGWLVAALQPDGEEYVRRKRLYGLACADPRYAPSLLDAFGREVPELRNRSGDKRVLAENYYPAFIWFPPGKPYEQAQQLCPEEFSRMIGAGIKLQSVRIELARGAPLLKRLDIQAPWLDEIRIDQRERFTRFGTSFKPNRQAQLETDGSGR